RHLSDEPPGTSEFTRHSRAKPHIRALSERRLSMMRFTTLAILAAPLSLGVVAPAPVAAQAASPLAQVTAHLKAVDTMTANFAQTDRKGQTLTGVLTMKRPGK